MNKLSLFSWLNKQTISYCLTLFIFGGPCHLFQLQIPSENNVFIRVCKPFIFRILYYHLIQIVNIKLMSFGFSSKTTYCAFKNANNRDTTRLFPSNIPEEHTATAWSQTCQVHTQQKTHGVDGSLYSSLQFPGLFLCFFVPPWLVWTRLTPLVQWYESTCSAGKRGSSEALW